MEPTSGKRVEASMRRYEFETHQWSRIRNDERLIECIVAAIRNGWTALGYEVRLYARSQLLYTSPLFLERRFALDESDALLGETLASVGRDSPPAIDGGALSAG
jgi:hypothetical protein